MLLYNVPSLSNTHWHLANGDMIADVKSKIIVSRQHFFANAIFFCHFKSSNYQNKTPEKSLYPSKYVVTTYLENPNVK